MELQLLAHQISQPANQKLMATDEQSKSQPEEIPETDIQSIEKIFNQAYVGDYSQITSMDKGWKNLLPIPRIEPNITNSNALYFVRCAEVGGQFVATKEEAVKLYLKYLFRREHD